ADTAENDTAAELAADAAPENAGAETAGASPETDATRAEAGGEEPQAGTAEAEATVEQRKLVVAAWENADPSLIATTQIYNGTKKVKEYARAAADQIQMPTLGEYTRQKMGILTFRTDAFRQNAAIGTVEGMNSLELAWTAEAGSAKGSSGTMYYGVGWVGQPVIVKWSKEVREQSEMYDAKKEKTGLREVIVAGLDGRIYFLDLSDGTATRNNIRLGYPMKGTPSVHPSGAPYMTVGQFARKMAKGTGTIGLRQYNLYSLKEMSLIDGLDAKNNRPFNNIGSFETSALIDRKTSTLVTAGTNGMLYVIKLNSEFDYGAGVYTQSPTQVLLRSRAKGEKDASTAVEASVAMYDRYVYYADMGGFLRCVDTNSMTTAWAVALGDSVEATPALDWHGEDGLDLYVATELSLRKKGEAEIKCIDALSGEERWSTGIGVQKDTKSKTVSGFRASPVIGQEGLSDYVYFTVNNLNDAGRETLNLSDGVNAAVIALRKTDGGIVWSYGLGGRGYSSPVAVYDEAGNGAVIQCAGDGSIVMLDGLNGKEKASLEIDGAIEASPAVYNNMMVIATTEKNKNNIYGIRIQ
ncbi:MAG: PQQ-like beta-propeller repeat protein, partial [Clostridia bacterium]|nr:PQQ-like beta-propeller repeat protein [Clostridia bacterium]